MIIPFRLLFLMCFDFLLSVSRGGCLNNKLQTIRFFILLLLVFFILSFFIFKCNLVFGHFKSFFFVYLLYSLFEIQLFNLFYRTMTMQMTVTLSKMHFAIFILFFVFGLKSLIAVRWFNFIPLFFTDLMILNWKFRWMSCSFIWLFFYYY